MHQSIYKKSKNVNSSANDTTASQSSMGSPEIELIATRLNEISCSSMHRQWSKKRFNKELIVLYKLTVSHGERYKNFNDFFQGCSNIKDAASNFFTRMYAAGAHLKEGFNTASKFSDAPTLAMTFLIDISTAFVALQNFASTIIAFITRPIATLICLAACKMCSAFSDPAIGNDLISAEHIEGQENPAIVQADQLQADDPEKQEISTSTLNM